MQKSRNVRVRSFQFAIDVVAFARIVSSRDPVLRRLAYQLVDAAGSVGANLQEAAEGQSKRDFITKNCIALKEASESRFWLLLIAAAERALEDRVRPLAGEAGELVAMLVAVVKTARSSPGRGRETGT
jgi:four helix bundle protein